MMNIVAKVSGILISTEWAQCLDSKVHARCVRALVLHVASHRRRNGRHLSDNPGLFFPILLDVLI